MDIITEKNIRICLAGGKSPLLPMDGQNRAGQGWPKARHSSSLEYQAYATLVAWRAGVLADQPLYGGSTPVTPPIFFTLAVIT